MTSRRQEIQVGIAVLLSAVVLIVGLLWFQEYRFRSDVQEVRVRFHSVGGLGKGDPVQVRGIPLGKVEAVRLEADGVLVTLQVETSVRLTDETRIEVGSTGLVGERVVMVDPGHGKPIDPATLVFDGHTQPLPTDLVGRLDEFGTQVEAFLERLDRLLSDLEGEDGLAEAVAHASKAASSVEKLLVSSSRDMSAAARSLASFSMRADTLLSRHGAALGRGMDGLGRNAAGLDTLVTRLNRLAEGAEAVLNAVRDQEGTLGQLVYDGETSAALHDGIAEIRALIADIRRNPKRYLGLTLVDF